MEVGCQPFSVFSQKDQNSCNVVQFEGLYRCEVEVDANQPMAVVHTVEILGWYL